MLTLLWDTFRRVRSYFVHRRTSILGYITRNLCLVDRISVRSVGRKAGDDLETLYFGQKSGPRDLEKVAILDGAEEYATLALPMTFTAIAAPLGSAASRHGDPGRARGCEKGGELCVAVADGVAALLLGHDVV